MEKQFTANGRAEGGKSSATGSSQKQAGVVELAIAVGGIYMSL